MCGHKNDPYSKSSSKKNEYVKIFFYVVSVHNIPKKKIIKSVVSCNHIL